jgi:hypothetical protein
MVPRRLTANELTRDLHDFPTVENAKPSVDRLSGHIVALEAGITRAGTVWPICGGAAAVTLHNNGMRTYSCLSGLEHPLAPRSVWEAIGDYFSEKFSKKARLKKNFVAGEKWPPVEPPAGSAPAPPPALKDK